MSENPGRDARAAETPDREIRLEHTTWPEVRERLETGSRTAVVAVGAVEQHGPHLLLGDAPGSDAESGELADLVASRLTGG